MRPCWSSWMWTRRIDWTIVWLLSDRSLYLQFTIFHRRFSRYASGLVTTIRQSSKAFSSVTARKSKTHSKTDRTLKMPGLAICLYSIPPCLNILCSLKQASMTYTLNLRTHIISVISICNNYLTHKSVESCWSVLMKQCEPSSKFLFEVYDYITWLGNSTTNGCSISSFPGSQKISRLNIRLRAPASRSRSRWSQEQSKRWEWTCLLYTSPSPRD